MPLSCEQSSEVLRGAWRRGRLSHAHILAGDVEYILENVLTPLLREMLCADPHGHADVHVVQPKSKSRQIVVEDIDDLILKLNQTTFYAGGYRFALILHADRMNTVTANKFLKTLEEPYPRTHIFLVTEQPSYLLPTVRSRCALLSVKCPTSASTEEVLALMAPLNNSQLSDPLDALLWAREVEQYLCDLKKNCEAEMHDRMKEEIKMLEGSGREEKEVEMQAAASALYSEKRAALFAHLIGAAGSSSSDVVRILEEAHSQMLKNLQDAVVLENLALKICEVLNRETLQR